MKNIGFLVLLAFCCVSSFASQDQQWQLKNEQSMLVADIRFDASAGRLSYRLTQGKQALLQWSPLGLILEDQNMSRQLSLVNATTFDYQQQYPLMHGKQSKVDVDAQRLQVNLINKHAIEMTVLFHLQADGLAFQYQIAKQAKLDNIVVVSSEESGFALDKGQDAWLQGYQEPSIHGPAYEYNYFKAKAGDEGEGRSTLGSWINPMLEPIGWQMLGSDGWAMPALFQSEQHYILLAEANMDGNYPGTHLAGKPKGLEYNIEFPHPEEGLAQGATNAVARLPLATPWRVIIAGPLDTIVASTLITDLSDPLDAIFNEKLPVWVKPGAVAWDWWDDTTTGDLAKQKRYVDAAAALSWPYVLVDANWNMWNDSQPEKPIRELVAYAAGKNVNILLWYNSGGKNNRVTEQPREVLHTQSKRRREFAKIKEWGVKGVKVDFWHTDKQWMMQQYVDLLTDAAEFELMVNFHGSTMPRGWRRTFPNMMTMEAVRGAEFYQFSPLKGPTAQQNLYYAFTRNVVGPMDYTPVVFQAAYEKQEISYAHSLALSVVFESAMQHFADKSDTPEQGYPLIFTHYPFVKEFMSTVPTAWDETLLLSGHPDSHGVFARRHNNDWYIGGIHSGQKKRSDKLSLGFLGEGTYLAKIIEQGDTPNTLKVRTISVNNNDYVALTMHKNGGFVLQLQPEVIQPLE
ncbi:glycoside hydrolase family 97 protein [uncultured Paraglaciecola sp.]|uniref:glycoside hydrolase family 97 protein n=1 Tax=uncultured Paraglaciecola sp. TaxID=1765024 RepID=UPI0026155045|nr:glycoside hydrolase family 97 protein [uncultured Paraglaciecola sp.]